MHVRENRIQIVFYLALLAGALYVAFLLFKPYLAPLFIAFVLYILWKPVHERIAKAFGRWKSAAAASSLILAVLTILVPVALFGVFLSEDASNLYDQFVLTRSPAESVEHIAELVRTRSGSVLEYFGLDLADLLSQGISKIAQNANQIFSGVFNFSLGSFIMLIALFYLFRDGDRLRSAVAAVSPLPNVDDHHIVDQVEEAVGSVVKGSLLVALVQGFLAGIGFIIFGIPSPMVWASLTAVTSIIPNIGVAAVFVPMAVYAYFQGSLWATIGLALWGVFVVGLVDNVLRMFMVKTGAPIHPFVILMSVIGGVGLFGAVGLVAGPVIVSFVYALFRLYSKFVKVGDTMS